MPLQTQPSLKKISFPPTQVKKRKSRKNRKVTRKNRKATRKNRK